MVLPFLAAIAPFAPLIGGAISAAGSLFAPKPKASKQTETVTNSIDLGKLRADAEAHGFNPLTIIRGGGLAGYTNSTGAISVPAGADMRLSNAFQVFGSAVSQWQYDPYGQQKSQMELRLAEAQIRSLNASGGAGPNMSLQTPSASGSPVGDITSLWAFGSPLDLDPNFADGELGEQRWGEVGGSLYGLGVLAADLVKMSTFNPDAAMSSAKSGVVDFAAFLDAQRERVIRERTRTTGGGNYPTWTDIVHFAR